MPHGQPLLVLVMSASTREGALNERLVTLAAQVAERAGAEVERARIAEFEMPFYDQDLEAAEGIPEGAQAFCRRLKAADALVIAAPEYNASMPGVLKNLIDWVSRFRPQPFNGRQCLLMSASPSMVGGDRGLWSLRIPLEHLGTRVYPDMFSLARRTRRSATTGAWRTTCCRSASTTRSPASSTWWKRPSTIRGSRSSGWSSWASTRTPPPTGWR